MAACEEIQYVVSNPMYITKMKREKLDKVE